MTVDEVATYFRFLADEPDKTFLPDSAIIVMMKQAYNQYYRIITDITDKPFSTTHNLSNFLQAVDLTVAPNNLLGTTGPYASKGRMTRLNAVIGVSVTGGPSIATTRTIYNYVYDGAADITELGQTGALKYLLQDRKLMFNTAFTGQTLQLQYTYFPDIDWTKLYVGDNEYIDEFAEFHDIISLLMYKQYAIKDLSINPAMENQLNARVVDFKSYLAQGQAFQNSHYVGVEYRRTYGTY